MKIEFKEPAATGMEKRQSERFTGSGGSVVLQDDRGDQFLGVVVNESFGGAGIIFDDAVPVAKDSEIEVTYHGVPALAIVRHVTSFAKGGCMVGVHWTSKAFADQSAELQSLTDRPDLDLPGNLMRLIELMPGGIQLMLRLHENERWAELSEAIDRLCRDASSAGVRGTDECLTVLMQLLDDPKKEAIREQLNQLIDKFVEKTTEEALRHERF